MTTSTTVALRQLLDQAARAQRNGDFVAARTFVDRAHDLARRRKVGLREAVDVALTQGHLHHAVGNRDGAGEAFQRAVGLLSEAPPGLEFVRARVRAEHGLGAVQRARGRYHAAEDHLRQALTLAYAHLEPDAPELLLALNELGMTFKYSGKFPEAVELYGRALEIMEARLGPDHQAVATIYHNLGGLAHARGDFVNAEPLARQAVTIREGALGADHPAVAADRAALAPILDALGRHDEAQRLLQEALQIYVERGDDYEIGVTLNNLGAIAFRRDDPASAMNLFRRALASKELVLGENHPELAPTLNNLAVVHEALGNREVARALYERAIAILEAVVEPSHPTLAACRRKHATLGA